MEVEIEKKAEDVKPDSNTTKKRTREEENPKPNKKLKNNSDLIEPMPTNNRINPNPSPKPPSNIQLPPSTPKKVPQFFFGKSPNGEWGAQPIQIGSPVLTPPGGK